MMTDGVMVASAAVMKLRPRWIVSGSVDRAWSRVV
jgi:hypothetical protein